MFHVPGRALRELSEYRHRPQSSRYVFFGSLTQNRDATVLIIFSGFSTAPIFHRAGKGGTPGGSTCLCGQDTLRTLGGQTKLIIALSMPDILSGEGLAYYNHLQYGWEKV